MNRPDFETRLGQYLAHDPEPPAGFAERVLPGITRRSRPAPGGWPAALVLTAAIVIAAAIACAVHLSHQSVPIGPAPVTGLVSLKSIHLITPLIGWADASELTPDYRDVANKLILRTTDGGTHWRNVTPPQPWQPASAEFLDGNTAWAISFLAPGEMSVMRTRDGGDHWQETRVRNRKVVHPKNTGRVQFSFVDADHGWFFVYYDDRGDEGALYRTVDGGSHWAIASVTDPSSDHAAWIPFRGSKNGLTFVDQSTGWLAVGLNLTRATKPLLWVTHDGGRSWSEVTYPDVPGLDLAGHAISRPRFFSRTFGEFEVFAEHPIIYATRDGGASWQPVVGPAACCEISFLDMNTGWIVAGMGKTLLRTSDGGQHWQTVHMKFPRDRAAARVEFVTPDIGIAVLWSGVGISVAAEGQLPSIDPEVLRQTLGKTTDGGATWTEMPITVS